jgi:hypothetical protein
VPADIVDVSVAGIQLRTRRPLRQGEFVRVRMSLGDALAPTLVDPDALVVRVQAGPRPGRLAVGLAFYDLPPSTLAMLYDQIASYLPTDAPASAGGLLA